MRPKYQKTQESAANKTVSKAFSAMLQVEGLDLDKNAVQRIESGERFVTDIELKVIAKVLKVSYEDLLDA